MTRNTEKTARLLSLTLLALIGLVAFGPALVRSVRGDARRDRWVEGWLKTYRLSAETRLRVVPVPKGTPACFILQGAKERARTATRYDASYRAIPYPMGDVPDECGACADVVVRSLRSAGTDLQQSIHEDMRRDFAAYPNLWGLSAPDPNIDHRRTPNQMCYLRRHWQALDTEADPKRAENWRPGDLVYWQLGMGTLHCGVVSDRIGPSGLPLVIHNLSVCKEEDCLAEWKIIAHFRHPEPAP